MPARKIKNTGDIGDIVKNARKKLNLKQIEAAGLLGVGVRFLSELERGKATLEVGKVLQVLKGLKLDFQIESQGE